MLLCKYAKFQNLIQNRNAKQLNHLLCFQSKLEVYIYKKKNNFEILNNNTANLQVPFSLPPTGSEKGTCKFAAVGGNEKGTCKFAAVGGNEKGTCKFAVLLFRI